MARRTCARLDADMAKAGSGKGGRVVAQLAWLRRHDVVRRHRRRRRGTTSGGVTGDALGRRPLEQALRVAGFAACRRMRAAQHESRRRVREAVRLGLGAEAGEKQKAAQQPRAREPERREGAGVHRSLPHWAVRPYGTIWPSSQSPGRGSELVAGPDRPARRGDGSPPPIRRLICLNDESTWQRSHSGP